MTVTQIVLDSEAKMIDEFAFKNRNQSLQHVTGN